MDKLYKDFILDHYKNPYQRKLLKNFDVSCQLKNPYCGDEIEVFLFRNKNEITEYCFWNKSCALLQASASMLMQAIKENNISYFFIWKEQFEKLLSKPVKNEKLPNNADVFTTKVTNKKKEMPKEFYNFQSFSQSSRKKCILLPWEALSLALEKFYKKEYH